MSGTPVDSAPEALALDLGSTRIKAGRVAPRAGLQGVVSVAAPPLQGTEGIREGDPGAYRAAAEAVLRETAAGTNPGIPLGVASQRSTFLLWRRADGEPATRLISWQDRRAASWCDEHRAHAAAITRTTGLVLSAHYVGPKLATVQRAEPEIRRALHTGELLFGNLETWLLWCWSGGAAHETDLTMAARTLMVDLDTGDWSPELLRLYDVPRSALPRIRPTTREPRVLANGAAWTAGMADQAAGALAVLDPAGTTALITLGTGAFVMRLLPGPSERRPGFLTAPVLGGRAHDTRWALEGSINGTGPALGRFGPLAADFAPPSTDRTPDAFCVPDAAGLGAPHWRPDIGLLLNPAAERLDEGGRRRIVREGLIFRLREVLDGLSATERVLLSGGLASDPLVGPGLAAALGRPVDRLDEPEAGLVGVGRLAAGLAPFDAPSTVTIDPPRQLAWLAGKYERWRRWLASVLARSG